MNDAVGSYLFVTNERRAIVINSQKTIKRCLLGIRVFCSCHRSDLSSCSQAFDRSVSAHWGLWENENSMKKLQKT
jgi:hypothetical protein